MQTLTCGLQFNQRLAGAKQPADHDLWFGLQSEFGRCHIAKPPADLDLLVWT